MFGVKRVSVTRRRDVESGIMKSEGEKRTLETSGYTSQPSLSPQQVIMNLLQTIWSEMIPAVRWWRSTRLISSSRLEESKVFSDVRSSITIEHSRSFDHLFPSLLVTPLAFEQVVSLTRSVDESEQFSHVVSGEMTSDIFFRVDDTGGQVLFVRLSLEN